MTIDGSLNVFAPGQRPGSIPPDDGDPQDNPTMQIRRKTTGRP